MKLSKKHRPRILQIGAGRFGRQHLLTWMTLAKKNAIDFLGVVERRKDVRRDIERLLRCPTFKTVMPHLLRSADGVDIVTPPGAHAALVRQCIRYTHVFVEKPLTLSSRQSLVLGTLAEDAKRLLMVGHIYRYNPVVLRLRELMEKSKTAPLFIECTFTDFVQAPTDDCGILFSDLHVFDILDALFPGRSANVLARTLTRRKGRTWEDEAVVLLAYHDGLHVSAFLSWNALPKTRAMRLRFPDKVIDVDFFSQIIRVTTDKKTLSVPCSSERPLIIELRAFASLVSQKKRAAYPSATTAASVIRMVEMLYRSAKHKRPIDFHPI